MVCNKVTKSQFQILFILFLLGVPILNKHFIVTDLKTDSIVYIDISIIFADTDDSPEKLFERANIYKCPTNELLFDPTASLDCFTKAADLGNDKAQYEMGMLYLHGKWVEKDEAKALEYFQLAANQNNPQAYHQLGYCYEYGYGTEVDLEHAAKMYHKGADLENSDCYVRLYRLYVLGRGVKRDYIKSLEFVKKASDVGNFDGKAYYGSNLIYGMPLDRSIINKEEGMKLYQESAEGKSEIGMNFLASLYMYDADFKDCDKARELIEESILLGHTQGYSNKGEALVYGTCYPKDEKKAIEYLEIAAKQNCRFAFSQLGRCYEYGLGVIQDTVKAAEYYQKGADLHFSDAQCWLGRLYEKGDGVVQDINKAIELYQQSVASGMDDARMLLGSLYQDGKGVEEDLFMAMHLYYQGMLNKNLNCRRKYLECENILKKNVKSFWNQLLKSVEKGNPLAKCFLGTYYMEGNHVECDYEKGAILLAEAADEGYKPAEAILTTYRTQYSTKSKKSAKKV